MIAAWMLYCVALGVLLVGAAVLAEGAVAALGGAVRRVWALAMTGAVVLPTAMVLVRGSDLPEEVLFDDTARAVSPVLARVVDGVDALSLFDGLLLELWGVSTLLLLVGFGAAAVATRIRRRRWDAARVDGVEVLVSDEVGPAVVGFLPGRVVLPRWALEADPRHRAMMVRHETEHLAAGDPRLLLLAVALLAAMPWNPTLWFMLRRLRLAVEVDCDARVLRSGAMDVGDYGSLLLAVGRRRGSRLATAAAFSRPRSTLWHRIERMTRRPAGDGRRRAAALLGAVAVVLAAAWYVPQPVRAADAGAILEPCPEETAPKGTHRG